MNAVPFWSNNPFILLNSDFIFELYPTPEMSYASKLNAITRLIIVISVIGYMVTSSVRILLVAIVTLVGMWVLFKYKNPINESFDVIDMEDDIKEIVNNQAVSLSSVLKSDFKPGNIKNPFSNVLLTQINDDPNRLAAPPAFNPKVDENITRDTKKTVQFLNGGINNTNKQLFGSLWDRFTLDQSNRSFYSTPNTRVASDQGAYAAFLYGDMPSAKGSSPADNIQREKDNARYPYI